MQLYLYASLGVLFVVLVVALIYMYKQEIAKLTQIKSSLVVQNARKEEQINSLQLQLQDEKTAHEIAIKKHEVLQESFQSQKLDNATLEAKIKSYEKLQLSFEEQGRVLELKLSQIMQQEVESKLKKLDENSEKSLQNLLSPFRENLNEFKEKVEFSQNEATKRFAQLSLQIEYVQKAGLSISSEAHNLTQALKGKKQFQGSWGEMILESVLECSGLVKGVHYETQESFTKENKTFRPDVIIKLPKNKSIVIDSKVSLVSYDELIREEEESKRLICQKNIVKAFKNHIDTLSSKDYARYDVQTLQYVFMFVPIEGAFSEALKEEPLLYEYALKKNIAIVTPSTLTVSLRTIYLYWQSENSNQNAYRLFEEAGKLYDKMYIFSENFTKIGITIDKLHKEYDTLNIQLSSGNGNLLTRTSKLKELGARTTKQISNVMDG